MTVHPTNNYITPLPHTRGDRDKYVNLEMEVKAFIPTHCTSLKNLPQMNPIYNNREDALTTVKDECYYFTLFVHRERAMWNLFHPILSLTGNAQISTKLIFVLLRNFLRSMTISHIRISTVNCRFDVNNDEQERKPDILDSQWVYATFQAKLTKHQNDRLNDVKKSFCIYIIPPLSPFISRKYVLRPERTFSSLLVQLENFQIQLQSLNAYIATLGGGYFLCHYLSTAVSLARYQRRIALQLNDVELAMKCTINEAYNYIHAGKIVKAFELIEETERLARSRIRNRSYVTDADEDKDVIISMCNAAGWFALQVQREMNITNVDNKPTKDKNKRVVSITHDDLQRIRVVRVRSVTSNVKIL